MKIEEAQNAVFLNLLDKVPDLSELRVESLVRLCVLVVAAIHVLPSERGSIIADYHSIRVEHRNDLEDHLVSEGVRNSVCTKQKLDEAMENVGGVSFSRVYPGSHNDHFLLAYYILIVKLVGDRDDGHIYTTKALGQDLKIEDLVIKVHIVGD